MMCRALLIRLTLYPSRAIATHEFFNVTDRDSIEITIDGVLETACSHSEFQSRLTILIIGIYTIDQSSGEGIPAAYAIYDVSNIIVAAEPE